LSYSTILIPSGSESCYQQIQARLVDRSLDEVFEKAREFRVAMEDDQTLRRHQYPGMRIAPLERWITGISLNPGRATGR